MRKTAYFMLLAALLFLTTANFAHADQTHTTPNAMPLIMTITPYKLNVTAGSTVNFTVILQPLNGLTGYVSMFTDTPPGMTIHFHPSVLQLQKDHDANAIGQLTVTHLLQNGPGQYTVTVRASTKDFTAAAAIAVNVSGAISNMIPVIGHVRDLLSGQPIQNALVEAYPVDSDAITNTARTDKNGFFNFTVTFAKTYIFGVAAASYLPLQIGPAYMIPCSVICTSKTSAYITLTYGMHGDIRLMKTPLSSFTITVPLIEILKTVHGGGRAEYPITVAAAHNFTGVIYLHVTSELAEPLSLGYAIRPENVSLKSGENATVTLMVYTYNWTKPGMTWVTVTAVAQTLTKHVHLQLIVNPTLTVTAATSKQTTVLNQLLQISLTPWIAVIPVGAAVVLLVVLAFFKTRDGSRHISSH